MKVNSLFPCKGCREMARLVGKVEDLRQMMGSTKRMVTGQEEKGVEGEVRMFDDTRQQFDRR